MDIRQFVKEVLSELATAVNEVDQSKIKFYINPAKGVDFDLAVTTSSNETAAKNRVTDVKIKVVDVGFKKGSTVEASEKITSRIKFNIAAHKNRDNKPKDIGLTTAFEPFFKRDQSF
jgi:hypothetical protein